MNIFRRLPKPNIAQFAFSLVVLALFFLPTAVKAQGVNDFVITSFDAKYELNKEHPQGKLIVKETIALDYSGQNRGIFRSIPAQYQGDSINLEVQSVTRDGAAEPYIVYEDSDNKILKIGDADVYLTGEHVYEIKYSAVNVIRFYDDHDEFYWDINGDGWQQNILVASVAVKSGATYSSDPVECFVGGFGDNDKDCKIAYNSGAVTVSASRELQPNETLTIVAAYAKGYFTDKPWHEKYKNQIIGSVLAIPQLLILNSAFKQWKKFGKDPTKSKTKVPYFGRPVGVSLMQAAYVSDGKVTPKHLTASIIDLAVRGFIKISETRGKKPKHDLVLLKALNSASDVTADERILIKGLFSGIDVGKPIRLEDQASKLHETQQLVIKKLDKMSIVNNYFELSPRQAPSKFGRQYLLGGVALALGTFSSLFVGGLGMVLGGVVFASVLGIGALMSKRSINGDTLKQHYEGLIYYLSKAEKDRLAAFDAVAAPLASRGAAPKRDVKFFEKLLPFAIAGGVEKTWAKAFSDIYTQPPEWFDGKWNNFSAAALASSIGNTASASSAAFSPPASSSSSAGSGSSGIGGGGFSGGGGGGGGGGGW